MKLRVHLDTQPLNTGHALRGIGTYTRELNNALSNHPDIELTSKRNAQILHLPYFDLFSASLSFEPLRSQKRVVTIHDVIPLEFPELYSVGLRGRLSFVRQLLSLRTIDHIITDSYYSKKKIAKHLYIDEASISSIYLAAHSDFAPQDIKDREKVLKAYNIPEKYVLYVGDINANKNLIALAQAFEHLPNELNLVCVGKNFSPQPIPEWEHFYAQASKVGLDRFHFLTTIGLDTKKTLAALYESAVCTVCPSLSEGFGLPALEALQSGGVLVSTPGGSLPEVGANAAMYTEDFSSVSIAKKIKEVLSLSKVARQKRIKTGISHAQTFSWEKTADETVALYKSII